MGQKRPPRLQVAQEESTGRPHPTRLQGIVIMKAFISPSSAQKKDIRLDILFSAEDGT